MVFGRHHQPSDIIAAAFVCVGWAAVGLLAAALARDRSSAVAPGLSVRVPALLGASIAGGLLASWGVRPQPGLHDLGLGIVSPGGIGLLGAVSVLAVAYLADRHLG